MCVTHKNKPTYQLITKANKISKQEKISKEIYKIS